MTTSEASEQMGDEELEPAAYVLFLYEALIEGIESEEVKPDLVEINPIFYKEEGELRTDLVAVKGDVEKYAQENGVQLFIDIPDTAVEDS